MDRAERAVATTEITQLIGHYGNCLDRGDFDALQALFTDDAEFHVGPDPGVDSPLRGNAGIRQTIERRWRTFADREQRRHAMLNVVVESLTPDEAEVRTTIVVFVVGRSSGDHVKAHGLGVFDDIVVRRGDTWLFRERRLVLDRVDYFAPGWVSPD